MSACVLHLHISPLTSCSCIVAMQVSMLNAEHNPDIMLLAARALTFMADVMPSSCSAIIRCDAVPAFCARLLSIEYIDLAEQSLQVGPSCQLHPQSACHPVSTCAH